MFSSFDHTPPSLRTSRRILGRKRQRYHPPSSDFGLSWLLLPLVKPVLVRSSARSNEDTTESFLSKNHTNPIDSYHMDTNRLSKELREIASDKASGVSVELVGDSLAHMRGTITGTNNHLSLSLFALSFKVFEMCANLSQETAGKVVSLYRALVRTHSFSRLTNSCCTHRDV